MTKLAELKSFVFARRAVVSAQHEVARSLPWQPSRRSRLVCRWVSDPATGKLSCLWLKEDATAVTNQCARRGTHD
jgi:hypothetical protein